MRAPFLAAWAVLATAMIGIGPAQAAWQDTATVSGSTIATMGVDAPEVTCTSIPVLGVLWLRFSWDSDPNAVGYEVQYGLSGTEEKMTLESHQTYIDIYPGIGGSLTVTRTYPGEWTARSEPHNYYFMLGILSC